MSQLPKRLRKCTQKPQHHGILVLEIHTCVSVFDMFWMVFPTADVMQIGACYCYHHNPLSKTGTLPSCTRGSRATSQRTRCCRSVKTPGPLVTTWLTSSRRLRLPKASYPTMLRTCKRSRDETAIQRTRTFKAVQAIHVV